MVDFRQVSSPKPMRATYIGSGRLELLGKQATYRKKVRFVGVDHKDATAFLNPGDVVYVKYRGSRGSRNRIKEPRVDWIRK